ncbi:lysylphosphatidylglycerol synthase transmembrane domain-containing protein [Bifidobacterium eulemuris]|uniref:Flippase-like domain-containing protein n=1 Tax=Bifidobacterium eulemuris TaxID=1765219 RepID=A0A261GBH1_9BIFI|nr:lysylphosphatidylglycerol synthase transmembrane domain-containing protein [Bifidobacterium eulemuris]OZG68326.1 hypothetical protein BEUL_1339 [Bifidobacterium eulemuris]QOL31624.1 flippase-like domain-containing protein [Bifidobacterium eulemuris]
MTNGIASNRRASATTGSPEEGAGPQSTRSTGGVHIDDIAPRRTRDFGDLMRAALAVIVALVAVVCAATMRGLTSGVESDAHTAAQAIEWLADVPSSVLQQLATIVIVVMVLAQLLLSREWFQAAVSAVGMLAGYGAIWGISALISGNGGPTLVAAMSSAATAYGIGLLPDVYAGIGAFLTVAGPRRIRSTVKWAWNMLYALAAIMVVLSWHSVTGMMVALATGRMIGMLIRFAIGTRNTGVWGEQLVVALKGIGLNPVSLVRRHDPVATGNALTAVLDDDLVEGSRIYDVETRNGRRYLVSVLDGQRHTAGYLKQLWQWMRFTGVSMRRDRSTRDATQHHQAMLMGLEHAGLPVSRPYGVADTEDSSVLVLDANTQALPCNLNTLTNADATAYMRYLDVANRRGYTHRRITPDTLARLDDGTPIIAGWHNGDNASMPANVALDKVQMLALMSALIGVDRTIEAAQVAWGLDTLVELAPFVQKVAVPSDTRALPSWDRQLIDRLRKRLLALGPQEAVESMEPVALARFSPRSFIAMALLIVAVAVVFTQLKPDEVIAAVTNARPSMAAFCLLLSVVAWLGSSLSLGAFIDRDRRNVMGVFMSQVAAGFATVSMPAGVGPSFVNLQFLRRSGYRNTPATAIISAVLVVYYVVYVMMLVVIGLFTGRDMLSGMIPTNTLIIVLGVVVIVCSVAMMIPPVRRLIARRLVPIVKSYTSQLWDVLSQPRALACSAIGVLIQNVALGLAFWAALLAFGTTTNPIETMFVFMLANALGSAVPTPGGLGGVEAALTFAFVAVGVPQGVALSATLLYRVVFYWLRIPLGALAMRWLARRNLV